MAVHLKSQISNNFGQKHKSVKTYSYHKNRVFGSILFLHMVSMQPQSYQSLIQGYNYDQVELPKEGKDLTKLMSHAQ